MDDIGEKTLKIGLVLKDYTFTSALLYYNNIITLQLLIIIKQHSDPLLEYCLSYLIILHDAHSL